MPKRTRSPKLQKKVSKSKEPSFTVPQLPVGPASSLSATPVSQPLSVAKSTVSTPGLPIQTSSLPESTSSTSYPKELLKSLHTTTLKQLQDLIDYYRVEGSIGPDQIRKADKILNATSFEEASILAKKAVDSGFLYCMGMWGQGKAEGPRTVENLEKSAKRNEAFADWMEKKGNNKSAAKYRQKALEIRDEISDIRRRENGS